MPVEKRDTPPPPHCAAAGCSVDIGLPCSYRDDHDQQCPTSWCLQHVTLSGGQVYCSRHARTMAALGEHAPRRPALDDRGPSLVLWIVEHVEQDVRDALDRVRHGLTETIVSDPLTGVGDGRTLAWDRTWRLRDADEKTRLRVTLLVGSGGEPGVRAAVDNEVVVEGVPGWIAKPPADRVDRETERRTYIADLRTRLVTGIETLYRR